MSNRGTDDRPSAFELLPAIDLRGGRAVRLTAGDFEQQTVYDDDPAAVAERFAAAGARWIHVVDLDGTIAGAPRQVSVIREITERIAGRARCQVAGGLRDAASVAAAFAAGAERVVIGTAALRDHRFAARLVAHHGPSRLVVALDVRDGVAVGDGWRAGARGAPVEEALAALAEAGIVRFAATAIERDGALLGPDLGLLRRLVALGRGSVLASGGIRSTADVLAVREGGASGAIVGKALYEGHLDLAQTLAALD